MRGFGCLGKQWIVVAVISEVGFVFADPPHREGYSDFLLKSAVSDAGPVTALEGAN
jgi:hypothetical protein